MLAGVLLSRPDAYMAAFVCAFVGCALKIGLPPFHSWLPEAHPAAPAPASAIMSAAMIPLGFFALIKFFGADMFADVPFASWMFLVFGALGAVGGILFALPQANIKRLLAFSSVENMGVVAMGIGLAALFHNRKPDDPCQSLCFAAALVHILNHAFLKGSLFLSAGSILRQTQTLDQDRLGGLLKRMPFTGSLFVINAFALSSLPPFNAFIGELALYIGAFAAIKSGDPFLVGAGFLVMLSLSSAGALAVATYVKAIGSIFLAEARSQASREAVETPKRMWMVQLLLTLISVAMIPVSIVFINSMTGGFATDILTAAAIVGGVFAMVTAFLILLRRFGCPRGAKRPRLPVWDCGYDSPTPRMAYTATAFTQPLADSFRSLLRPRRHVVSFKGECASPCDAAIAVETDDIAISSLWRPIFTKFARLFQRAHLLQNGSLHLYILVILLALILLLVFALIS
jgi:formate hydrogenlyase subunit 3/multisubunit Na+/H+ antiporter MnhD subunit